jgi:D-serine dehydratase
MPEPGLAVLGAGKRDVSTDMGLPVPLVVSPAGTHTTHPAPAHWQIDALNDQHAYLRLGGDAAGLQVGDRVALGISHPCATFDRWRWLAVVDNDLTVVDALTTCF